MGVIGIVLLIAFIIVCILLVILVLLQNEEGEGLGGLFGGAGTQAFGSRSANVLTKTTYVLVALFFLSTFGLAYLNKTPAVKTLTPSVQNQEQENAEWWTEDKAAETPAQDTGANLVSE